MANKKKAAGAMKDAKKGGTKVATQSAMKGVTKKRVEDTKKLLELANEIVKKLSFDLGSDIDVSAAYLACLFSAIKLGKMQGKDVQAIAEDVKKLGLT